MPEQVPYIVYGLALLALVGAGMFTRNNASQNTRYLLIWAGVMLVGVLGYNVYENWKFRPSINADGAQVMRVPFDARAGGYRLVFEANSARLDGIVDTGATAIVLSHSDAQKAGIDMQNLRYSQEMSTANGQTFGAVAVLDKLSFGDVSFFDVPVIVAQEGDLGGSLLGMSFLNLTNGFSANRDVLIIEF